LANRQAELLPVEADKVVLPCGLHVTGSDR
jgi:hypothetical protein